MMVGYAGGIELAGNGELGTPRVCKYMSHGLVIDRSHRIFCPQVMPLGGKRVTFTPTPN